MIGLAEKSIVMRIDDAKDYVESKIEILHQRKDCLLEELRAVDMQLEEEMCKLCMLNNPPQ